MRPWWILPLLLVGCGKGRFSPAHEKSAAGVLTYPLEAKVTTLDPGKVQDVDMLDVLGNVFEGLVAYDENNQIAPRLAERWETTDGGRTLTFHLRSAKFQDGTALEAADFKRSWERNLSKTLASPVALDYLGDIAGVKEFAAGQSKSIEGVEAIDSRTLRVRLNDPRPYFLGNLTYPCTFVVSEKAGRGEMRRSDEAVGTGPFRLEKVAEDIQVELSAFKDYWGGPPKLVRIVRPVVVDPSSRLNGYRNGSYDLVNVARGDVESIQRDPKMKAALRYEPRPAVFYFLLNQKAYAPFKDVRVRKAFAMSLDQDRLVGDLLTGFTPAHGLVAPGVPGYQPGYKGVHYDPKAAATLLAEAGYPGGQGLPALELAFRSGRPDARLACEAAATAWRRALGAPVSPRALEWGALLKQRNEDRLQMGLMSWYADYLDPQNFLSLLMTSTSAMNHDGYSNPEFDRLCAEADVMENRDRRIETYRKAERIAVEDVARIPLYYDRQPQLVSPRIHGLRTNLFGLMPHTTTFVKVSP